MRKAIPLLALCLFLAWVPESKAKGARYTDILCESAQVSCVEIQEGDTWDSLWPEPTQQALLKAFNRVNIRLRKGMRIAVPLDLASSSKMALAPFPLHREAGLGKGIWVDLNKLAWGAYDGEGNLLNWGPASGGKSWCPDVGYACKTPNGEFHVLRKQGAGCKSSKFPIPRGGAPMPYCMHFKSFYALHGSYEVPGYNASHGCVRLFPEDAKWLNENFIELPQAGGILGTSVHIEPYGSPAVPVPESKEARESNQKTD